MDAIYYVVIGFVVLVILYLAFSRKENFTPHQKDTVYFVFADWCDHCQKMKPIWYKAKEKLKDLDVSFVELNSANQKTVLFMNQHDINHFPYIMMIKKDDTKYVYSGEQDLEKLSNFISQSKA